MKNILKTNKYTIHDNFTENIWSVYVIFIFLHKMKKKIWD